MRAGTKTKTHSEKNQKMDPTPQNSQNDLQAGSVVEVVALVVLVVVVVVEEFHTFSSRRLGEVQ